MAVSGKQPAHLTGDRPIASTPQSIADRRELTFIAVERTRMPMVIVDPRQPDSPIVMANAAFLKTTGYPIDEIIGRNCRFLQGRDTYPKAVEEICHAIAEERDLTIELLNCRKDGSTFWNELYLSPVHGDDGKLIYFFLSLPRRRQERRHDRFLPVLDAQCQSCE